jgi:hypothetical protein
VGLSSSGAGWPGIPGDGLQATVIDGPGLVEPMSSRPASLPWHVS